MPTHILLAETPRERRRVLAFVRRHARRLYDGSAPSPSEVLLYAETHRRLCGTIALDFAGRSGKLPLEFIYRIDQSEPPWVLERDEVAQFGKWWAIRPGVAVHLMYAAYKHALARGKRLGLAEAKPAIMARVEEFGMSHVRIPGAVLQDSREVSRCRGYYASLPLPQLYTFDIQSNASALGRYIELNESVIFPTSAGCEMGRA